MQPITNFTQLVAAAKAKSPVNVAVVTPQDESTMLAIREALENGLANAELFGDPAKMEPFFASVGLDKNSVTITSVKGKQVDAVVAALDSVRAGRNQVLMKGSLDTSVILREVLNKDHGIREAKVCSFVSVCEVPGFNRLIFVTDGGLNLLPDTSDKIEIAKNAIELAHALGIEEPKVAVLAAVEKVNLKMPATTDAAILAKMSQTGVFGKAIVDGPLALDNAVSEKAAATKGINSPVAGKVDIILAPCIEVGNALGKSLTYFGGSSNATIVLGAKAPIVVPSRAGKPEAKWASLALGALLARRKDSNE